MKTPSFDFNRDELKIQISFEYQPNLMIAQKDLKISYFSSGPGGQHANRHMNGVRLVYRIPNEYRRHSFKTQELIARSIHHRHREANLKEAFEILFQKIRRYFYVAPVRKKTKLPKRAKEKRLKDKRIQSLKKQSRKGPF